VQQIQRSTVTYYNNLLMDIYTPPAGDARSQRPAAIVIHGGGWTTGNRKSYIAATMSRLLAQHGFVAASIDYTLNQPTCRSIAYVVKTEIDAAVQYIRSHAAELRVDTSRIVAFGDSAGGLAVALMVVGASNIAAGVSLSGRLRCDDAAGVRPHANEPPYLDFHCRNDRMVPYQTSVQTVTRMKQAGAFGDIVTFSDQDCARTSGHYPSRLLFEDMSDVIGFLYQGAGLSEAQCPLNEAIVV